MYALTNLSIDFNYVPIDSFKLSSDTNVFYSGQPAGTITVHHINASYNITEYKLTKAIFHTHSEHTARVGGILYSDLEL